MPKTKILVNDLEALQILLQEQYNNVNKQIKAAQNEIATLQNTCPYKDVTYDEIAKISKAKKDQQSLINDAQKTLHGICKLMSDVIKYQGDVDQALEANEDNSHSKRGGLDIASLKKQLKETMGTDKETYNVR